jgi:tetratricopeptide (TPR) repeat protein
MIKEEDLKLLASYLSGDISQSAKMAIEDRLGREPSLAHQLELLKLMPVALDSDSEAFKRDLAIAIQEENKSTAKTKVFSFVSLRWMAIASISILVLLTTWFILLHPTPQSLYASYFSIPPENISTRNSESMELELRVGVNAYSSGDFESAANHLNQFLNNHPERTDVHFYHAISLLAYGDYERGLSQLQDIDGQTGAYNNAIKWYMALAHLVLDEKKVAQKLLEDLSNLDQSRYAAQAKELLGKIN